MKVACVVYYAFLGILRYLNKPCVCFLFAKYFNKKDKTALITSISILLVSAILYQVFIFPPNDSPSKTIKNAFYFFLKALFVLEIFTSLYFFCFLSTLSRLKGTNGSGIIYDVVNWLA